MNDKLLNLATLIFFASILGNGMLIMLSLTPGGALVTGLTNDDLGYNNLDSQSYQTTPGFISNTSQSQDVSSFNPLQIVNDAGAILFAGINALNFVIIGLCAIEVVFVKMSGWFPIFAPILLSVAGVLLGVKALVIGYFLSILLKAITGGR